MSIPLVENILNFSTGNNSFWENALLYIARFTIEIALFMGLHQQKRSDNQIKLLWKKNRFWLQNALATETLK